MTLGLKVLFMKDQMMSTFANPKWSGLWEWQINKQSYSHFQNQSDQAHENGILINLSIPKGWYDQHIFKTKITKVMKMTDQ